MAIVLTEKAAAEVKRVKEEQKIEEETFLRIGVAGGGCSGFNYQLGFDREFDEKRDTKYDCHGVRCRGGQEKLAVPGRHDHRLVREHRTPRLHVRQPERGQELRLRQLVPGVNGRKFVGWDSVPTVVLWMSFQA